MRNNAHSLQSTSLAMLNVGAMGLEGSVPACLFNYTALYQLSASGNSLTGSIPEILWSQNLTILNLSQVRGDEGHHACCVAQQL